MPVDKSEGSIPSLRIVSPCCGEERRNSRAANSQTAGRVSSIGTAWGEMMVVRVLDRSVAR